MELARRAQQMDLKRVAADLAHDTCRAVEEPAADAEVPSSRAVERARAHLDRCRAPPRMM